MKKKKFFYTMKSANIKCPYCDFCVVMNVILSRSYVTLLRANSRQYWKNILTAKNVWMLNKWLNSALKYRKTFKILMTEWLATTVNAIKFSFLEHEVLRTRGANWAGHHFTASPRSRVLTNSSKGGGTFHLPPYAAEKLNFMLPYLSCYCSSTNQWLKKR